MTTVDFDVVANDHASAALLKVARSMELTERATDKVSNSLRRQADTQGRVRLAQTRLAQLQQSGKASVTQLATAEEALARAKRADEAQTRATARAQQGLARAQQQAITRTEVQTDAARTSTGVHRRWAGALSRIGGVIATAAAGATVALGATAVAGGVVGIKTAAGMEQARIAFTTMLGSAKKADKFIRQLAKFAAETPFDFPGLQQAASSLVSAGIDADKVIPIMKTLGDVTSGMGTGAEGIQRATVALQQMNAAQRISGEDLNQLRDAGIPVYDLLAKALGKSKKEVVALAQKGKLGKDALDKMMSALTTGKGLERFNGLMEKQSQSLSGLFSTLKDNISQGLANAVTPAIPSIKLGLEGISDLATKAFAGAAKIIPPIAQAVEDLAAGFSLSAKDAASLGAGIGPWVAIGQKIHVAFAAVAGVIRGTVLPAIKDFGGWLKSDLWPALRDAYQTILPGLREAFRIVGESFGDNEGKAGRFRDVMARLGNVLTTKVIPFVAKVANFYLPLFATQATLGIRVARGLWTAFTHFGLVVARVGGAVGRAVLSMFGIIIHAAASAFGWVPGVGPKLKRAAAGFDAFRREAEGALSDIENAAYDLANGAERYGANWAKGLANGIHANAHVPVAQAQVVASKVASMMRSEWQQRSPSRVAAKIGQYFGMGLAVGIRRGGSAAVSAAKDMAARTKDILANDIAKVTDLLTNAKSKLADLKSQFADIANGVRDAVRGGLDLTQFTNSTSLRRGFDAYAARVKQFAAAIKKMIAEKYPSDLIQQVANLGVDGLPTALAFANASATDRRAITADYKTIGSIATDLGTRVANTTSLDEQIRNQRKLIDKLDTTNDYLRRLYAEAKKTTRAEIVDSSGVALYRLVKKGEKATLRARRAV